MTAGTALAKLKALWQRELLATRAAQREQRNALDLGERVRRGLALQGLRLVDTDAGVGNRALLWFSVKPEALERSRFGVGDPVLLWLGTPDSSEHERGIVARRRADQLGIMVASNYGEFLENQAVQLDREAPEVTFERGHAAITRFERDKDLLRLREVLFGERPPEFAASDAELQFRDTKLNASQQGAVRFALRASDVALIHGPPGTGKTRTLVEIVRQALQREQSVLVTAPSNTAVDNLAEKLLECGVRPLRLGHPARVSKALESRCLDVLIEKTEEHQNAKRWLAEAAELRKRVAKKRSRGQLRPAAGKDLLAEARKLSADARRSMDAARARVLRRTRVVCTTAAGADDVLLEDHRYDFVILDEATQAADPIALSALQRGGRVILAGDPRQLPPTIVDRQAAKDGLGTTLFERGAARFGDAATYLLTIQYRMHAELMQFPSQSMYDGKLIADSSVSQHRLEDLPAVAPDSARNGPWFFLDAAGKGWSEERRADDASTQNPRFAQCTANEIRKLLARGVAPEQIAAISPYSAQVRLLRELLRAEIEAGLEVGTIDGFQGREKEAVVVDLVRSNEQCDIGFLADIRRMNVAITRARRFLLVVGDSATLAGHDYYRRWIDCAQAQGAWLSAFTLDPSEAGH